MKSKLIYLLFTVFVLVGCEKPATKIFAQAAPSHELFDALLKQYVDNQGMVNYRALQRDSVALNKYLSVLSATHPHDGWSKDEQLAFWINAYNAFTLRLIIRHYPITSIKDITSLNIPFLHSPWDINFITIEGVSYDLNNIEHGIIRKQFEVPEIHFALVCAARSCPPLRREAYLADKLHSQLLDQAYKFLSDQSKNNIDASPVKLSKLFLWYRFDFTSKGSLIAYLNAITGKSLSQSTDIDYMDYDWRLNQQ